MGLAAPFRSLAKARPEPRFLSLKASRISLARFLLSVSRRASACFFRCAASSLQRSASARGARWDCLRWTVSLLHGSRQICVQFAYVVLHFAVPLYVTLPNLPGG